MKRILFAMLSLLSVMQAGICADVAKPFSLSIPGKATRPVLYFADHDLHAYDPNTEYAVIIIHGVTSGTHDYAFSIRPHLAAKYPALRAPYIIAPGFPFEDLLAKSDFKGYACWKQGSWASGNDSVNAGPVCAYDVVDEVFAKLMDAKVFPNLKHVLLMGFSAGGQFVNRYVAVGKAPQRPGVAVDFAVGSPSSWLYLDDRRPQKDGSFAPLTGDEWKGYNKWHCGLENKDSIRYVKAVSAETMWTNVMSRHVLCYCGRADDDPSGRYVANGRTARAEGASRLERLRNYRRYVALFPAWAKQLDFLEIPGVGHKSAICFLDPTIIRLMYGQRSKTYYVDAQAGNDAADGLSPETAIQSLARVNNLTLGACDRVLFKCGGLWRGQLRAKSGEPGWPVFYGNYGEGPKPILQGSLDRSRPEDWTKVGDRVWATRPGIPCDVGIFICNHGARWGVKKWDNPDWAVTATTPTWGRTVTKNDDLDFWYNAASQRVFVRYPQNPGAAFDSIELALTRHIVDEGGCHDVTYDGLHLRYGAAHGIGGGNTRNITIRNCDVCWIGGGLQYWHKDAAGRPTRPVRYGNGIEFWGECHNNLVECNHVWQIYDAALTNQTKDNPRTETDIIWRSNLVEKAEYSFEYWNHDPKSQTSNILFEGNTCLDAGFGWGHAQRPDPNGAHLMFYDNAAPTTNFVVRNNRFIRTTDRCIRFFNDWRDGLVMTNNVYWIPEGKFAEYHLNAREKKFGKNIFPSSRAWGAGAEEFKRYQREFGLDADSTFARPAETPPCQPARSAK